MKKVKFTDKVRRKIYSFFEYYKSYYEDMYTDSGLWSEDLIIQNYVKEADNRQVNMVDTITNNLQNEAVSYPNNIAFIRWKTKFLIIQLSEIENTIIVEDIEIR